MNEDKKELEKGFINKEKILQYISEEEIFALVFGFIPNENETITSPFREDNNPGCCFSRLHDGKLVFQDFANSDVIRGIRMNCIDCFDAVQIYYKIPNFYMTLKFIRDVILGKQNIINNNIIVKRKKTKDEDKPVEIFIDIRNFTNKDKRYWKKYGITEQNLIDDKVFPISKYRITNTKVGNFLKRVDTICYCYSNFEGNRKKLYLPYKKGVKRFVSNCQKDDIGELDSLVSYDDLLIISKSYKDCRVLKNEGLNSIWFQNEGMIPKDELLFELCSRFENIVVLFDNDEPGIMAGSRVTSHINNICPNKCRHLYIPQTCRKYHVSDPSDMFFQMGRKNLQEFLRNNI